MDGDDISFVLQKDMKCDDTLTTLPTSMDEEELRWFTAQQKYGVSVNLTFL